MIDLDLTQLAVRRGEEVAVSDWIEITQSRIDQFADAIDDRQWIHVDPARAVDSPFGGTIAHGFLTLSLVTVMSVTAMTILTGMAINYGINHVRFIAPVPVGSRLRGRFRPVAFQAVPGATQVTWNVTIERDGDGPCCSFEWTVRYYAAESPAGVLPGSSRQ